MRLKLYAILFICFSSVPIRASTDDLKLEYHGAGWLQMGRIENTFALPGAGNDYAKNWLGQSGGLLIANATMDEHWDGSLGIGTVMVQLARGSRGIANKWYPFWVPFVDEARITYSNTVFSDNTHLKVNMGSFHYGYNPDVKNFGLYLMHGYVYPGAIASGFTGPLGVFQNMTGIQASLNSGVFSNDLMLATETDDKPLYDLSIADVANFRLHPAFEIGLGFNFYRVIPMKATATSPDKDCSPSLLGVNADRVALSPCYIIDTTRSSTTPDTILGSLAGTKLMARFHLDPKALFEFSSMFGKDDFIFYGELAVLGTKNYPLYYNDIKRRIPVMLGFNLPGFNFLNWSVEGEYYASKNSGDNLAAKNGSWVPVKDDPRVNTKRDDWKWSVNVSKVLAGHIAVMGQVANDHLRLGGNHDEDTGVEALRTPKDWYWTTKIAYFF